MTGTNTFLSGSLDLSLSTIRTDMIHDMNNSVVWNGQQLQTTFNEGKCRFTLSFLVYFRWEPKHMNIIEKLNIYENEWWRSRCAKCTHTHTITLSLSVCLSFFYCRFYVCTVHVGKWKWKWWSWCWYAWLCTRIFKPYKIRWRAPISKPAMRLCQSFIPLG